MRLEMSFARQFFRHFPAARRFAAGNSLKTVGAVQYTGKKGRRRDVRTLYIAADWRAEC